MDLMDGGAVLEEGMDLGTEGLDMIILVGMIGRWVVDLVIPMKGPMVDIWVGHLEAIEVVHLIGILVMAVLLMLSTPQALKGKE